MRRKLDEYFTVRFNLGIFYLSHLYNLNHLAVTSMPLTHVIIIVVIVVTYSFIIKFFNKI